MLKIARQIIWIVVLAVTIGVYLNYDILLTLFTEGYCPRPEVVQVCGEQPVQVFSNDVDHYFGGQSDTTTGMDDLDPSQFFKQQ